MLSYQTKTPCLLLPSTSSSKPFYKSLLARHIASQLQLQTKSFESTPTLTREEQ